MILAIGSQAVWSAPAWSFLERLGPGQIAPLRALDAALLERLRPVLVVSPWMCGSFDCLELAMRLAQLGYTGPYRAVAEILNRPQIVRREVREASGGLDFDLVVLSAGDAGTAAQTLRAQALCQSSATSPSR